MDSMDGAIVRILLMGVLPIWLCAGLVDWVCHVRQNIAERCGPIESALHLLMIAEIGLGVVMTLFFEVNALLLSALIGLCVLHQATGFVDTLYAARHRPIGPLEQHVHSVLDASPLVSVVLLALVEIEQSRALFGIGDVAADFRLRLRQPMLPAWLLAAVLGAATLSTVLPFGEELRRGLRARSGRIMSGSLP